jgi:hypothetical protein
VAIVLFFLFIVDEKYAYAIKNGRNERYFARFVEQSTRTGKNDTQAKPSTRPGKVQIKVACQLSSVVAN